MKNPIIKSRNSQSALIRVNECPTHHCEIVPIKHHENNIKVVQFLPKKERTSFDKIDIAKYGNQCLNKFR